MGRNGNPASSAISNTLMIMRLPRSLVIKRGVPQARPTHAPVNRGNYGGVCPGHGSDDLIEILIRILNVILIQNLSVNLSRFLPENLSEIISGSISGNLSENLSGITLGYTPPHSGKVRGKISKYKKKDNCPSRVPYGKYP